MSERRGPPARGVERRLTSGEANAIGCSHRWWIRHGKDGVLSLLRPWRGKLLVVHDMTPVERTRMQRRLDVYWHRRSRVTISGDEFSRIVNAARAALATGMNRSVTAEMQWVAGLGER